MKDSEEHWNFEIITYLYFLKLYVTTILVQLKFSAQNMVVKQKLTCNDEQLKTEHPTMKRKYRAKCIRKSDRI